MGRPTCRDSLRGIERPWEGSGLVLAYTAKPMIFTNVVGRRVERPPVYGMIAGLGFGFGTDSLRRRLVEGR
jgi:hypothetical protein